METNYLFDPIQFKEFGFSFFEGSDFYYRYQISKKLFKKHVYIPFGPNCKTKQGFLNFLEHTNTLEKITIDLPMIYSNETKQEVISLLKEKGFKQIPYVHQDEETIIINKEDFKISSKLRNKINHGHSVAEIQVKQTLNEKELNDLYNIYLISSKRINFNPKSINIKPPANSALFLNLAPNLAPVQTPAKEIKNVVTPIIPHEDTVETCKKANVIPTASASMLVAIERTRSWRISAATVFFSRGQLSSSFFIDSMIIFTPKMLNRAKTIQ